MVAVSMTQDANAEIREEDYAATMMAVQNLLRRTPRTRRAPQDPRRNGIPRTRAAVGVPEGEHIVATIPGRPAGDGAGAQATSSRPDVTTSLASLIAEACVRSG